MRLLNVHNLDFEVFHSAIPKYVIASHRWALGSEASIKDVRKRRNTGTIGYRKILGYVEYVKKTAELGVDYLWIDTCCINQDSSEEVAEAVNSMFKWYRAAEVCLAYLADVTASEELNEFRHSQWFTRGWTLQELLAPQTVIFLTRKWEVIGHKGRNKNIDSRTIELGPSLEPTISATTGIPEGVLSDYSYSMAFSAEKKLMWMTDRNTTREEDQSYCLLGMFDVTMPIVYGEGQQRARNRLLAEIERLKLVTADVGGDFEVVQAPPRSLYEAASSGELEYITQLLDASPTAVKQLWKCDAGGSLPLHRAVRNGHALCCRLLMTSMNRQTWDAVDLLDTSGTTPIQHALSSTDAGSEDVIREFLTDEGLCFSVPTILTVRRSSLMRIMEIGGTDVIERALLITRRTLEAPRFCDLLRRFLPTAIALPQSDRLVPQIAAEVVKLQEAEVESLSTPLRKLIDTIYDWAVSERVKRLVALQKAVALDALIGSEGLNFVGKAIVAKDLPTLTALHAIDFRLFSEPVGWWDKHPRTNRAQFGPWAPIRFAALLGHPDTVRQVAEFSEPEDSNPPHLRAVHFAAIAAAQGGPPEKDIWHFLRGFTSEGHEVRDAEYRSVDLSVEFDSDWGMIMFPYSHEAFIEEVLTATPEKFTWDSGFVKTTDGHTHAGSSDTITLRVRMRFVATGYPESHDNLVHVDFMHGWNDSQRAGGKGRMIISPSPAQTGQEIFWFREKGQHEFSPLQQDSRLASGTNWRETFHNLHSWQLQCVAK